MKTLLEWIMLRVNRFRFRRRLRRPYRGLRLSMPPRRKLPRWIRMSRAATFLRRAFFRIKVAIWFCYFQRKHKLTDSAAAQAIGISLREYRRICRLRHELHAPAWFGFCKLYDLDPNIIGFYWPYSRKWRPILPYEETSRLTEEYYAELASKRRKEIEPSWFAVGLRFNLRRNRRAGEYETASETQQ